MFLKKTATTKKKSATPTDAQRSQAMCCFVVHCFLTKGRMQSWTQVDEALKMRLSSVEMSSMSISRQNSPQIPGGKMVRNAIGVIFCPKPILYFCWSSVLYPSEKLSGACLSRDSRNMISKAVSILLSRESLPFGLSRVNTRSLPSPPISLYTIGTL